MKKRLLIISMALIPLFYACNDGDRKSNIDKNDTIMSEEMRAKEQQRVQSEADKQVAHLERIIEQNKKTIEEYEIKIATGDTADISGLPQYVEELKAAVAKKEERLAQLKKNK